MSYANYALQFANNESTTLGSAVGPTDTSITVGTGTGASFPTLSGNQAFVATLVPAGSTTGVPNEVVLVTAHASGADSFTVVRAQDGTTAQSFNVGDTFAMYPTAGTMGQFGQPLDLQALSGSSGTETGTANAGVLTLAPVPASLAALKLTPIRVLKGSAGANTGPYTLNVNGLGAVDVRLGGLALIGGELQASLPFTVVYDGAHFQLVSGPQFESASASGVQNQKYNAALDQSASANSYNIVLIPTPVPNSPPADFFGVAVRIAHTNTGASTLNLNGGTAYPIKKVSAGSYVDVAAGDLTATHIYQFIFNGAVNQWQLVSPAG